MHTVQLTFAALASAAAVLGGCSPYLTSVSLDNPARAKTKTESTQTMEIPPNRENHQIEATLADWSPGTIVFRFHLLDPEECGKAAAYTFTLVDENGSRYAFRPTAAPVETTVPGHNDTRLNEARLTGVFDYSITAATKFVKVEARPNPGNRCVEIDYRWDFQ